MWTSLRTRIKNLGMSAISGTQGILRTYQCQRDSDLELSISLGISDEFTVVSATLMH
jgi:hypothetical protein